MDEKKLELRAMENQSEELVVLANTMKVESQADYEAAGTFLKTGREFQKAVKEFMDPITKSAKEAHTQAVARRDALLNPAKKAATIVEGKMETWYDAEEAKRKEEEARLQAEAQKEAEERKIAEAKALEDAGEHDAAQAVLDEPPAPPPPKIAAPKADGVSHRKTWKGECVNLQLLVEAVAAGKAPITLLQPAKSEINSYAKSTKGVHKIPGIRWFEDRSTSVR